MKRQLEIKDVSGEPDKKKFKSTVEEDFSTSELPSEILEALAAFILEDRSRRRLRLVCKKWLKIMNYTTFTFSPILPSEIGELVSVFSGSSNINGLRLLKTKHRSYQYEDLQQISKLTQLTSFVGHFEHRFRLWNATPTPPVDDFLTSLTNLESLEVTHIHSEKLDLLTKLRKLKVESLRNSLSDPVIPVNLPNLQELSISIPDLAFFTHLPNVKHFTLLDGFNVARDLPFTALESLTVERNILVKPLHATLTRLQLVNPHEEQTSIDHLTNLKHLEIRAIDVQLHLFQHLEVFRYYGFSKHSSSMVEQLSMLPRLRDLHIELQDKIDKSLKLIGSMTTLQALSLSLDAPANPTPLCTLTNLKSLTYHNVARSTTFDWLKELTSLSELDLSILVDRRLPRESLNITPLHYLTRLVFYQIGTYTPHCLTTLTKLLDLKLQARSEDRHQFVGLSTLTQLTSLEIVFQTTDDDWQEITQLTNLMSLAEIEYVGSRPAHRLLDLTAMQNLTRFVSQHLPDGGWNLTALTSLQSIDANIDNQVKKAIREKLKYLEKTPPRFDYEYL